MSCAALTVLLVAQSGSGLQVPMSEGLRVPHALLMSAVALGTDFVPVAGRQLGSRGPNELAPLSFVFWHFVPSLMISLTIPASTLAIVSTHLMRAFRSGGLPLDRLALPAVASWLPPSVPSISGKIAPTGSPPS